MLSLSGTNSIRNPGEQVLDGGQAERSSGWPVLAALPFRGPLSAVPSWNSGQAALVLPELARMCCAEGDHRPVVGCRFSAGTVSCGSAIAW
jgi:hypothetical protein